MNWDRTPWPTTHSPASVASRFPEVTDENERQSIADLLNFIEAPESLQGLIPAINCLEGVIKHASGEVESKPFLYRRLEDLSFACDLLQGTINYGHSNDQKLFSNSLKGLCGTAPFYAVLVKFDSDHLLPLDMTQTLIALFYLKYRKYWKQMNPGIRNNAGLACRSTFSGAGFGTTARFQLFYQQLDFENVKALIQSMKDCHLGDLVKRVRDHVNELVLLLNGHLGLGQGKTGTGNGSGRRTTLQKLNKAKNMISEEGAFLGSRKTKLYSKRGKSAAKANAAGLDQEEMRYSEEAISETSKGNKKAVSSQDVVRQKCRANQVAKAIAMKNLFLPNDWDQLNSYDLYVFLKELSALSCQDKYLDISAPKLAVFILLRFLRGATADQIWDCKAIFQHSKSRFNDVFFKLDKTNGEMCASLLIGVKDNGSKSINDLRGEECLLQEEAAQIALSLPLWATTILLKAVGERRTVHSIFKSRKNEKEEFNKAARSWTREANKKNPGARLSPGRIERYLLQAAMQAPDIDMAEAAYIFLYDHPVYRTQLYYTTIQVNRIQNHYNNLCQKIEVSIERECRAQKHASFLPKAIATQKEMGVFIDGTLQVGSKYTPTSNAVNDLRVHCLEKMKEAWAEPLTWKRLTNYHNAYVTYTLMHLAYTSGYRAVCDPLPNPRFIDRQTQFCVISDKDSEDAYCTRVVWLSKAFMDQLDNYNEHIRALRQHFPLIDNEGFKQFMDQSVARKKAFFADKKGRLEEYPAPPYLFCFNDDGKMKSIRPSWLETRVKGAFSLPINANRHFLRTNLVLNKCPKDTVDAFMGHWNRGREPWGSFSSLSPQAYSKELETYLGQLNSEMKWSAVRSKIL